MGYEFGATASITYGDQPSFDGASKLTVSYWIWPGTTAADPSMQVYIGRITNPYYYYGWNVGHSYTLPLLVGGHFANALLYGTGYDYGYPVLTAGAWNHVHVVYDGTQAAVVDRVKVWANRTSLPINVGTSVPTTLGTVGGGSVLFLRNTSDTVRLAEVGIWIGTAITSTEVISQLGASSAAVAPPDCGVSGLSFYMPLQTSAAELITGATPTVTDAVVSVSHPPMQAMARVVRRPGFVNTPRPRVACRTV